MPSRISAPATAIALIVLVVNAASAAAQDVDQKVNAGVAAGLALPFHGDFDFTATAWQADVRINTARHFALDLFVEEWRHTDVNALIGQTITGPSGPLGRADRVETQTDHRTRAIGANLLARGGPGIVTFIGGGGVSYLFYRREFSQRMSGCDPLSLCTDFSQEFDNSSLAGQVHAGIDVAVAPHVAVVGQFRLFVPMNDPAGGHSSFLAGVRFGL
jgi:hypothetical protein